MTPTTPWKPVIEGPRAEAAWQAIRGVADAVDGIEDWSKHGGSLSGGAAGGAILFGYLAKVTGEEKARATSQRLQEAAGDLLLEQPTGSGLFGGFPGIAWAATHLRDLLDPDTEDPASDIDDAMLQMLSLPAWPGNYDLIIGLVGHGVYGLERLQAGKGREILASVIGHLDKLAVEKEEGLAWFTPPERLPHWQREFAPDGYWNLGLAHGIPGVLALLGRAIHSGVEAPTARRLLEGGMAWLMARRNPDGAQGWFGTSLSEGKPWVPQGSRVAWCYGDLGLAVALLMASRDAKRMDWEAEVLPIARASAARPRNTQGIQDPGLCHGTAGNALIFLRLFHATGETCFRDAALDQLDWTLAFREPEQPFGGFPQHRFDDDKHPVKHHIPGLLEGGIGVALALLAALTDQAPDWDRHLLISLDPRRLP